MKKILITGLLIWIPLAITIWVLELIVSTMDQSLLLLPPQFQPQALLGYQIPGLGALLTVVGPVTGALARTYSASACPLLGSLLTTRCEDHLAA
jgi:uncharacterized membrane protein